MEDAGCGYLNVKGPASALKMMETLESSRKEHPPLMPEPGRSQIESFKDDPSRASTSGGGSDGNVEYHNDSSVKGTILLLKSWSSLYEL